MVHTNYDEYAIILSKKFSRRHGPTITAKLYGKGLEPAKLLGAGVGGDPWLRDSGVGRNGEFCFSLRIKLLLQDMWEHLLCLEEAELSLPFKAESSSFDV